MQIKGYNKTTLLDYPEHIASVIFTGGCNFRCPFCHNADLVLNPERQESIGEEGVLEHLRKRRGILQGVCITGGEPLLQSDLPEFIGRVKELGYLVKLDTNGYYPKALEGLLKEGILDYAAMDIKASRENYARAAGVKKPDLGRIEESAELLKEGRIPYEFRTTVVKGIHIIEEFEQIGQWLKGSRAYYLQAYRENENVLTKRLSGEGRSLCAFTREEMQQMAELAGKYIAKVELRGVE